MRKGGGKVKGASFERDICRQLSLWISKGTQEDVYWRSAMSGGRSTVAFAKGKRLAAQSGDMSCIHPIGEAFASTFFVEMKDYTDLNFIGLLKGKGHLVEFWAEAVVQARNYNKLPMLIAHQARQPVIACVDSAGMLILNLLTHKTITVHPLDLYIIPFEEFLRHDVASYVRSASLGPA